MKIDILKLSPSEFVAVAMDDMIAVEANPNYRVNMGEWHTPYDRDGVICHVCFAGGVISQTLESEIDQMYCPTDFNEEIANKLAALNMVRKGFIGDYLTAFNLEVKGELPDHISVDFYSMDSDKFKEDMYNIIELLIAEGY